VVGAGPQGSSGVPVSLRSNPGWLACILTYLAVAKWTNWDFTLPTIPPDQAVPAFVHMCLIARALEETIYRLVVCVPTPATFGPKTAILVSGATFAGLHFVYGNPSPDNLLAGDVLAWAYLESGSLVFPIALHSLGNAVAFAAQLVAWHLR
jgi:membrane protease YdiL (CAAX protease family)